LQVLSYAEFRGKKEHKSTEGTIRDVKGEREMKDSNIGNEYHESTLIAHMKLSK
jgi:hypothetical protein